jgi:hypothetical protein
MVIHLTRTEKQLRTLLGAFIVMAVLIDLTAVWELAARVQEPPAIRFPFDSSRFPCRLRLSRLFADPAWSGEVAPVAVIGPRKRRHSADLPGKG